MTEGKGGAGSNPTQQQLTSATGTPMHGRHWGKPIKVAAPLKAGEAPREVKRLGFDGKTHNGY